MTNSRKLIILPPPRILTCGRILFSVLTVFVLTVFVNAQDTVFRYAAGSTESNASGTDITTVQTASGAALGDVLKLSGDATQNGRLNLESNNGAYLNFTIQSDTPGTMRTIKKTAGSDRFYNFNTASGTNASMTLKDLSIQGSDSEISDAIGLFFHSSTSSTTVNLTVDNVTFSGFKNSGYNGGVIAMDNAGALTITGSGTGKIEFNNNYAKTYGGAIHGAETTITGNVVKFTNNTANANHGGAIYSYGGTLAITGQGDNPTIEFSGNTAGEYGGAIYSANSVVFSGNNTSAVFTGNTAANGNDIYLYGSSGTVLSFTDSGTYSFDGGIYVEKANVQTVINKAQVTIAGRANDSTNNYQLQTVNISNGGKLTANMDYIDSLTGTVNLGDAGSTGSIELNAGQGVSKTLSSFTISGAGGLTKTGAGTLELTTANTTFTGKTTVSGGTLKLSGSGKLASSEIDVPSGSTLTYYNTTPQNSSALTFNVNGGTLEFYNDRTTDVVHNQNNAICSGAIDAGVTINGTGGTLLIDGGGHVAVSNGNGSAITISMDANSTIYVKNGYFMNGGYTSQNWTDNKAALKIGSTGVVNLWDGTQMKVGGLIGDAGAQMIDTQSYGQGISVGNGVTSDKTYTYNGSISLNGKSIDFNGAGKQTLNGDITAVNMYNKAGTLILGTAGNDLKINSGVLIKADGGAVQVDGNLIVESGTFYPGGTWSTGTGTVTVKSGAVMRVGGTFGSTIGVTLDGGLLFNDGDHDGTTATVSSPIYVKSNSQIRSGWTNGTLTLNGPLTGGGNLTVESDSGVVVMATTCSDNSFTGNVQLNYGSATSQGQMQLGANQPFGANAGQANIYGTLDMHGFSQRFNGLYNNGDKGSIYNNNTNPLSTLTIDTTGKDLTFQSSITGNIALVITGNGTQTLNKAPGYSGSTTVESGTLKLNAASTLNNLSGSGTVNFGAKNLTLYNSSNTTFSGSLAGSGTLTFTNNDKDAWIVMDTNGDSFSGNVQIYYNSSSKQGRVKLGRDNAFGTNAGQANLYGTLDMNGYSQTFKGIYSDADKGPVCNSGQTLSTLTIDTTGKDLTYPSSIKDNIALVITGTGTQTLTGANTYTGTTTINGGTLVVSNNFTSSSGLAGSGTLKLSGDQKYFNIGDASEFTGTVQVFDTSISAQSRVYLAGANGTTSTNINLSNATVEINGNTSGKFSELTFSKGGSTLSIGTLNGNAYGRILNLDSSNTAAYNNLTVSEGTFAGQIGRSDASGETYAYVNKINLTKVGDGTFTLSGIPYYFGETNIQGGVLKFVNNNISTEKHFDRSNALKGSGTLQIVGNSNTWVFFSINANASSPQEFSGLLDVSGNFVFNQNTNLGNATLHVDEDSYATMHGGSANSLTVKQLNTEAGSVVRISHASPGAGNFATLTVGSGTVNGDLGETANNQYYNWVKLNKVSDGSEDGGRLTLAGAFLYTGETTVSGGVLELTGDAIVTRGPISVGTNGTLEYNITGEPDPLTINDTNKIFSTGKVIKTGEGTLKLYAAAKGSIDVESLTVSSGRVDIKEYFNGQLEVSSGATFSPGNSVGTLEIGNFTVGETTYGGGFILNEAGAELLMEIGGATPDLNDGLIVNGDITFKDGSIITLVNNSNLGLGESFTAILSAENSSGLDVLSHIQTTDFTELKYVEIDDATHGTVYAITGRRFTANEIPEPSTWALLILGAAGLLFWRKRIN